MAPTPPGAGGAGADRKRNARANRRRRKNQRLHRNRDVRSRLRIFCWNAEGLRPKLAELQSWLLTERADILAIQECQFGKVPTREAGFQPPIITRRSLGRTAAADAKGGDVALYLKVGLQFTPLTERRLTPADDTTEVCGVRLPGPRSLDILNIFRPPIRPG